MKSSLIIILISFSMVCHAANLVPQPQKVTYGKGSFVITATTSISAPGNHDLAVYLNDHLNNVLRSRLNINNDKTPETNNILLLISHHNHLPVEGYRLTVTPENIIVQGRDRNGLLYGIQTLLQLLPPEVYNKSNTATNRLLSVPCAEITDFPRYPIRSVMLDVSRTFFDKEQVKEYISWLAYHKINTFHWHLTDDNGWRIEIKKYPELTSRGAWRGRNEAIPPAYGSGDERYGGFYTQDDIREVVAHASNLGVDIIPEIDMPGHSLVITQTHPETRCITDVYEESVTSEIRNVWCAGREENYDMIRDILSEVAELFPSKYLNIGGDEVNGVYWRNCPVCQKMSRKQRLSSSKQVLGYFTSRIERIVRSLGKEMVGWDDIALAGGNLHPHTVILAWQDMKKINEALSKGQPAIMMPASYAYIDMRQAKDDFGHIWAGMVPIERLYSMEPDSLIAKPEYSKQILGVEAALWAELLNTGTPKYQYQSYPRICALAEVGWSAAPRDYRDFDMRLTSSHLDRLYNMGINFRLSPPEVSYANGKITAKATVPGSEIRYTTDGSEPNINSMAYTRPIYDHSPQRYSFKAFLNKREVKNVSIESPVVNPSGSYTVTVPPSKAHTVTVPLDRFVDSEGLWYLSFYSLKDNIKINSIKAVSADTSYFVTRTAQWVWPFRNIHYYADKRNLGARLEISFSNPGNTDAGIDIAVARSPYIEPPVDVTTNMPESKRFPFRNAADYNFSTYARSSGPCKAGDTVTYTFREPVECQSIEVRTGYPHVTRIEVTHGGVEYSYDGNTFTYAGPFLLGRATIFPEQPVKAVRIVVTDGNSETMLGVQDLRIRPKF